MCYFVVRLDPLEWIPREEDSCEYFELFEISRQIPLNHEILRQYFPLLRTDFLLLDNQMYYF